MSAILPCNHKKPKEFVIGEAKSCADRGTMTVDDYSIVHVAKNDETESVVQRG